MNPSAEVLNQDAGRRQRKKCKHRQSRADLQHEGQSARSEHDRVGRIHDCRTKQHANGIQIVGGTRHDVSDACALVVRVGQRLEMAEQIIAEIELNLARDTNQYPAHQELKDSLSQRNGYQLQRIGNDLVLSYALI